MPAGQRIPEEPHGGHGVLGQPPEAPDLGSPFARHTQEDQKVRGLLSVIKFAAGLVSNALCQTIRFAANVVRASSLGAFSLVALLLAILQLIGGGKKQSVESACYAWRAAKASLTAAGIAILQALGVLTMLSPLARAAQACAEGVAPKGIIAPSAEDRNFWQGVFGMNSWTKPPESDNKITSKKLAAPPKKTSPPVGAREKPKQKRQKKKRTDKPAWGGLAEAYLSSKSLSDMNKIRARMAVEFPIEYARALKEASRPTKTKSWAA